MYGENKAKTPNQLNEIEPNITPIEEDNKSDESESETEPEQVPDSIQSLLNTPVKKSQPSVLNKIFNHFGIDGKDKNITIEGEENEKIKSSLKDLRKQYEKITSNENNMKNLKRESSLLSYAQNALDEIKEEPTKAALEKELEKRDKDSSDVLSYLQTIGAVKNDSIDKNKLQENDERREFLQD